MIATPKHSSPSAADAATTPSPHDRLRLRHQRSDVRGEFVDGGWWPYSLNLETELPALFAALRAIGADVRRVVYHLDAWNSAPSVMTFGGHRVKLGGYLTQDASLISLVVGPGWDYLSLAVIPPRTDPRHAERALNMAGRDGDHHRPGEILAHTNRHLSVVRPDIAAADRLPLEVWDGEGGYRDTR